MKKVLFLCQGNTCRSQMAVGLAQKLGKTVIAAQSAGLAASPGPAHQYAIEAIKEEGIDISRNQARQATKDILSQADLVIALGVDPLPQFPKLNQDRLRTWPIPDPLGGTLDTYREVRDLLRNKIINLVIELARPVG